MSPLALVLLPALLLPPHTPATLVPAPRVDARTASIASASDPRLDARAALDLDPRVDARTASAALGSGLHVEVVSNRADLVSGGDALVRITGSARVRVDLNGADVTSAFVPGPRGTLTGLVKGLSPGENVLTARPDRGRAERLTITDHPRGGPVFSGPQVRPWRCQTTENGLGPAVNDQCDAAPVRRETTLADGTKATLERGTINRGVYDLLVPESWNHKLVWTFGAGTGQHYRQGVSRGLTAPEAVEAASKGFAVASSTMTDNSLHSNDVTSAETVMMVKEHIIETYGEIRYTIGRGGSGGALQQYLIADAYPGLLDGLLPTQDWPDQIVGAYREFGDCAALVRHMDSSPLWTDPEDRTAVFGHGGTGVCATSAGRAPDYMKPDDGTSCAGEDSYDPARNPTGVRCTLQDFMVSVYGTRQGCAGTPCARRPWDNVGVQYGLTALRAGTITAEQFADLNEKVGGFDIDMAWTPRRSAADAEAVEIAHRSGRVVFGRGLARVPIIAAKGTDNNDYHYPWRSLVLRNRLDRANGHHRNQVLWTNGSDGSPLDVMDRWLAAVETDERAVPLPDKVVRHRPPQAVDACWIDGAKITDAATCDRAYPHRADTRVAAGEGPTSDLLKCRLKPQRRDSYGVAFTDEQWARLRTAFPTGVCDYSKPGVGQSVPRPWLTFANGPGGTPLGPPQTSRS
ncbi:DUF6351 family protein [Nonomuraea purpurea]|uniref:DUF6351 family protein n=1 Tax=Nonomuraea purpurea TaxID=1849276 RepID=A0ABV8GGP6_9ACTN